PANQAVRIPGRSQSNQLAEVTAIVLALRKIGNFVPIVFRTDSMYTINGLTRYLGSWEDCGWIGVANSHAFRAAAGLLRTRTAVTKFQWVKGHSGIEGNEMADRLAESGAQKEVLDNVDFSVPERFDLQGARMSTITQKTAYRGIMERLHVKERATTVRNIDRARYAVEEITGSLETDGALWAGCRNSAIRRPVQQFVFKMLHGAYKVGDYWSHIPGFEDRATCSLCQSGEKESMEHILIHCEGSHRELLWNAAARRWPRNLGPWPTITFGTVLGCGSIGQSPRHGQPGEGEVGTLNVDSARRRLMRILISETAYMIWVMRCESVI
ncbi:RnaseH-domain-containing protein, partial [Punctularia strigosozonata HHB-11173 SS5]|uniref:RnaseH-domain-containing protein n=1 Tax=Punctularia strigosozonata (strain HHB-11173) TaxID=741275 RepID=UPI0004417CE5